MSDAPDSALGPWIQEKRLGKGGNGEVWLCRDRDSGEKAAVKVLQRNITRGDHYERFLREIRILREFGSVDGIMPLIASYLPEPGDEPTGRPWLAMPVARPLSDGFPEGTTEEEIVSGIARAADVLVTLSQRGVHHRDIKPQNLFLLDGQFIVGDFGLATHPDANALTKRGKKLGPMWFIAPEMLDYTEEVDLASADLYSLAKTLWVLLAGQRYPLPGEQRANEPLMQLSNYVNHL